MKTLWLTLAITFSIALQGQTNWYELRAEEFLSGENSSQKITAENFNPDLLAAAVFHASNEWRVENDLPTFTFEAKLKQAAALQGKYVSKKNQLSHINREKKAWRTPIMRIESCGGDFRSAAENLAALTIYQIGEDGSFFKNGKGELVTHDGEPLPRHSYSSLARKVVRGWAGSPGHRKNLSGDFSFLGVATTALDYSKSLPQTYFVQNFAKK